MNYVNVRKYRIHINNKTKKGFLHYCKNNWQSKVFWWTDLLLARLTKDHVSFVGTYLKKLKYKQAMADMTIVNISCNLK